MDCSLEKIVKEKFEKFNLSPIDSVSKKNLERIISIEKYLQKQKEERQCLIKRLKETRVTKVSIEEAEEIKISRKTIYNHEVLKQYIDFSIENEDDIFNEKKIEKLEEQIKELSEEYNKVINNIIEINILRIQNKKLINELLEKSERIKVLETMNMEQKACIETLNRQTKSNNIIMLEK